MNVSAQRIRVQGHITNPQGKSVPNVNVLNPVNDERIEMSDEDGRYLSLIHISESVGSGACLSARKQLFAAFCFYGEFFL